MLEYAYHPVLLEEIFRSILSTKKIHVIAPASGLEEQELNRLRKLPFLSTFIPENLINPVIPYHANTDEMRLAQLKVALYESEPEDIIWCLRGGYGSARLIDDLQKLSRPEHERTFIGYSDLTALHLFFSQQWGWRTIHAAGFAQLLAPKWDKENFTRLAQLIADPKAPQSMSLVPLNTLAETSRSIRGRMNGGNLTLVENSIGTVWQIRTSGCILFLEEVGEKGYRIDRALTHLKQANLLNDVRAVVFGECISDDEEVVMFALRRFANEVNFPVFQSQVFGHGVTNYPIVYQSEGTIEQLVLHMQVG